MNYNNARSALFLVETRHRGLKYTLPGHGFGSSHQIWAKQEAWAPYLAVVGDLEHELPVAVPVLHTIASLTHGQRITG